MKIAFIGGGNMATAMILGLLNKNPAHRIAVVEPFEAARQALQDRQLGGLRVYADAALAAADEALQADVLILAVKPQVMSAVAKGLAPYLKQQLVLSVAAGIRLQDLSRWLGGYRQLVRAMPNTPALIGMGITGYTALPDVDAAGRAKADELLASVGESVWIEREEQIDAVTALSGSGPAYVFLVLEAMQAAGEQLGLGTREAALLARHTLRGAAELAQRSDEAPAILRERVTSKGGTTAAALAVMQERDLMGLFRQALKAANDRGAEMGLAFGKD